MSAPDILVTGAGGHLGGNLARRLARDGRVRVLLHGAQEAAALAGVDVEIMVGDLRDPALPARAVCGCRQVYHCAARVSTLPGDAAAIFSSNVLGTRSLLVAARAAGVAKMVVTGSFSAVGHRDDGVPSDEAEPFNPLEPHLPYELSKAAMEHECLKAVAEGLDVSIAVSTAIIGPHDYKPSRMGRVLLSYARGRLPFYIPGGFEFVGIDDIVAGHLLAMSCGRPGRKYIFSTGFVSMDAMMALFGRATGQARRPRRLPPGAMAAIAGAAERVQAVLMPSREPLLTRAAIRLLRLQRRADTSRAREELGFVPGRIETAIEQAVADFTARRLLQG